MFAAIDSSLVAAVAVGAAIVVLVMAAICTAGGGCGFDVSPPRAGEQDYRKPHA